MLCLWAKLRMLCDATRAIRCACWSIRWPLFDTVGPWGPENTRHER